jgi:myo-inositol-1(or 4)-monophosphatase
VIRELLPRARDIRRAGAAALDLAWVAAGRVDAFFERGLHHWDWAAGRLLVEEAGGSITWLDGDWPGMIAASTAELVEELRAFVAP